jgi:gamma-glutamyltranspeptidase/glutathione hydrolase
VRAGLAARGHRIEAPATAGVFGGYQAVFRDPESGVLCGATESRKDGCALGF